MVMLGRSQLGVVVGRVGVRKEGAKGAKDIKMFGGILIKNRCFIENH